MFPKSAYLSAPCWVSSLPYWKSRTTPLPENMLILHDDEFTPKLLEHYADEPYFRLIHSMEHIDNFSLPQGFEICVASLNEFAGHINSCYSDIGVTTEELYEYTGRSVYSPELWLAIRNCITDDIAASGIAELDAGIGEGILEWIQVSPEYRRLGLGSFVVTELLRRMKPYAGFATVSGRCNDPNSPEALYRRCGFTGGDIWHILRRKST